MSDVEDVEQPVDVDEDDRKAAAKKARRSRWGQEPEAQSSNFDQGPAVIDPHTVPFGMAPPLGATQMPMASAQGTFNMDLSAAAQAAREALEKAKKAAMFQRQIQEQMAKLKSQGLTAGFFPGEGPKARKLILDEFGRELDEEGNVVPMRPQMVSTLKVNINREKEQRLKRIMGLKTGDDMDAEKRYFDQGLRVKLQFEKPKRRTFKFVEEGSLLKKEKRLATKVQEKALGIDKKKEEKSKEQEKKDEKKNQEEDEKVEVRKIEPKIVPKAPIPDMEWWDLPFLKHGTADEGKRTMINDDKITFYIEHPVPIKVVNEKEAPETAMMHLTPKERRKLRRLKRQERTQEIRDKIKMGILQPPPPKVKMSNLMRVLGDEAIADPSAVEKRVRAQVEQRRKEHEQRNEARKLPAEERKQKKKQKWIEDTSVQVLVCVFKIKDLSNKRHLFKVDMNAQQFHLTGCTITCPGVANICIAEGGPRAIKRYKKLMIRRIKWREDQTKDDDDDGADSDDSDNVAAPKLTEDCVLVWEGTVKQRNFKNWKVTHARTENECRKLLADRGAEHYWEMLGRYRDAKMDI